MEHRQSIRGYIPLLTVMNSINTASILTWNRSNSTVALSKKYQMNPLVPLFATLLVFVAGVTANCYVANAGGCYGGNICSYSLPSEGAYWCNPVNQYGFSYGSICGTTNLFGNGIYQTPVSTNNCPLNSVNCEYSFTFTNGTTKCIQDTGTPAATACAYVLNGPSYPICVPPGYPGESPY